MKKLNLLLLIIGLVLVAIIGGAVAQDLFTRYLDWRLTTLLGLNSGVLLLLALYVALRARTFHRGQKTLIAEREKYCWLEAHCQDLTQQIKDLICNKNLDNAMLSSQNLDEFMDMLARLAHEDVGAREFAFFLCRADELVPRAYYHLDKKVEFCLTFSPRGSEIIAANLWQHGKVSAEKLSVRGMELGTRGEQTVVEGELLYENITVGKMRLALSASWDKETQRTQLRKLVTWQLLRVNLRSGLVREAWNSGTRLSESGDDETVTAITTAVCAHGEKLGVLSVNFNHQRAVTMLEREKMLTAAVRNLARAALNENLYRQAIADGLTGLYNKRYLLEELAEMLTTARNLNTTLSIVIIDLDHFKKINDTHGHLTGDLVLKETAKILQETVRSCDVPCRYGGEELVVLLPDCTATNAAKSAERLRERLENHPFKTLAGKGIKVTASFGVAELTPTMPTENELIAAADAALYTAKKSGRNQVRLATA